VDVEVTTDNYGATLQNEQLQHNSQLIVKQTGRASSAGSVDSKSYERLTIG